jgi:hypothetical protein
MIRPLQWAFCAGRSVISITALLLTLCFCRDSTVAQEGATRQTKSAAQDEPAKLSNQAASEKQNTVPLWLTARHWKSAFRPFEDAANQGGKLMLQLPTTLERELLLARNGANRINVLQRVAGAAIGVRGDRDAAMEQQIKMMIPQYRQQYLPTLYAELDAVRNFCEPPKEARGAIFAEAEAAYDKALEEFVRAMYMPTARTRRGSVLRSSLRSSLAGILETKLPAAEFAKYTTAARGRTELRKRVSIECVVARLDESLRLTKEQRESIAKSLTDNWSDEWESWLMLWQYEDLYMPVIDDALIVGFFTPHQRRLWQQAQKISLGGGEVQSEFAEPFDASYWKADAKN